LKVEPECAACIISRGVAEVKEATVNPALRFRAMCDLLRILKFEFEHRNAVGFLMFERSYKTFPWSHKPNSSMKFLTIAQDLESSVAYDPRYEVKANRSGKLFVSALGSP
jgi:uncharacterized protein with ATP-grasp and redox domains